ncbi:beta-lactamase family protein [Blastopirellula retiformator]|uniref:beta-lactamase family protein n=1 Tax=Blastopirellula retiformator TaxID=2527970 RepID=UPI001FEAC648|nr:beta-lactamase family protein [Blastopirellula retiformator]
MVPSQTEFAAPEAGRGDPTAKTWDWNSLYWRKLGSPWGTTHCSAPDTARLMRSNQNGAGIKSRGLGFDVGTTLGGVGCSEETFGHSGSTGTLAWADPDTETIFVALTSLPARAVTPHPRQLVSEQVAGDRG